MEYQNNKEKVENKFSEIKKLEIEFKKVPSYTKAMDLIEKWEEYRGIVNESELINISNKKISFYLNIINGNISKEIASRLDENSLEKAVTNFTFS